MSRYFFHTRNGHEVNDEIGSELPSLDDAKSQAIRMLCELLPISPDFWERREMKVIVRDEQDLTLFELEAFATLAPTHNDR